ncbi:MAG: PPC domain-containing protein [Synechococcales bacterium]|nr:PPC domain-containing protein [Synechococcales bacterium]
MVRSKVAARADWGWIGLGSLLLLGGGGLSSEAIAASRTAASGTVQAEYTDERDEFCLTNPHLRITRAGNVVFDQAITSDLGYCRQENERFEVRDLDGDDEPEVIIDFYSGGAHCCWFSQIYRYVPDQDTYVMTEHYWGNAGGSSFEDLDDDGVPEFFSYDDRFAYEFASYAGSAFPPQFWRFRQGEMVDVTRDYPDRVYDEAFRLWQTYERAQQQNSEVKGVLAAYLATKYLLDQGEDGWSRLEAQYRQGDRQQYFADLQLFLEETGYATARAPETEDDGLLGATRMLIDEQGTLAEGDNVLPSDGSLYDEHSFEALANQQITITLESEDFDPYLFLVGPNNELIAQNDDINQINLNASITLTVPQTGTYRAIANAYNPNGRGDYTLIISALERGIAAIADLPDGNYFFEGPPADSPEATPSGNVEVFFQKTGNQITGVALAFLSENGCFQGQAEANRVIDVTLAEPPFGEDELAWEFYPGQPIDLTSYQQRPFQPGDARSTILQQCVEGYEAR